MITWKATLTKAQKKGARRVVSFRTVSGNRATVFDAMTTMIAKGYVIHKSPVAYSAQAMEALP